MRAGVWCGAAALALLAFASALRTPQLEGVSRTARRLPAPSAPDAKLDNETEDLEFRPRISRRREEILGRERARTRTRPTAVSETETAQSPRNERFDSRRTYNRTRHRPVEHEANIAPTVRESTSRSRSRQSSRRISQPSPAPEVSSTRIEGTKSNSNYMADPTPKVTTFKPPSFKLDDVSNEPRRRTITTTDHSTPRRRGRINTRVDTRALDLSVSGTTNTITVSNKEQTTARISGDLKNSRKLRYKTRLSETDTNLTGEGTLPKIEVTQSSQNQENITSQSENLTTSSPVIETTTPTTTEASFETAAPTKSTKVVRRPLTRGKSNFRPAASLPKVKTSDEIGEEDNYPASFKALIQAKNASTHTSSTASESLSVKASQKVYNTYTSTSQSTNTGPAINKYTRLRSKISAQDKSSKDKVENDVKEEESNVVPEQSKAKLLEIRPRTTYNPRSRKTSFSTSAPTVSNQNPEKPVYKFNRKFRPSTTEAPKLETTSKFKRIGTSNLLKKSLARPSYYSRRNNSRTFEMSSESSFSSTEKSEETSKSIPAKTILPKTSYYSRFRSKNKNNEETSSTTTSTETYTEPVQTPADKKLENSLDMPLIFSLLKNSGDVETSKNGSNVEINKQPEKEKKMFIIAVTSKESMENSTENEVTEKSQEVENKMVFNTMLPSQKYHSNFKTNDAVDMSGDKDNVAHEATPPIANIQTKKRGRKRTKPEYYDDISEVTPKTKDRSFRKYSDGYSKSTEPSTNGIPPDPEKQKGRFSSKYRGSYVDKPFYKPTVPTVTPSTAWLKFFVTDPQLAKSVEEPNWFEGEDFYVTTEMTMSRMNSTAPPIPHESSLELVEGEEIQLGPDMNAISITKTRSTLSSADLRLSESLDKPLQTMNVEASQHSPSVTISIFDALAEILTSTPRSLRLSSTTEVTKKQSLNDLQSLKGVSNSITVNSVKGLASHEMFTANAAVNTDTKFVQTTAQTPTVINRQPVTESSTQPLNTQDEKTTPVNTPTYPTPTTPITARRPFAIKVLYSDTELPTDIPTATEPIRTSIQPSTDSPMVLNTVSDVLIKNNNLVSSELTSMLSNNILDIIKNMDENTRSKISVDMVKILKSLIPRALDGLTHNDDVDIAPNTTPYSLEEIRDTENIDMEKANFNNKNKNFDLTQSSVTKNVDINTLGTTINIDIGNKHENDDIDSSDSLQTVVTENIVNSIGTTLDATEIPTQIVNKNNAQESSSTLSAFNSQTTPIGARMTTSTTNFIKSTTPTILLSTIENSSTTGSGFVDTDATIVSGNSDTMESLNDTNPNVPLPFFTNFQVSDFTPNDSDETDSMTVSTLPNPIPLTKSVPIQNINMNTQDNAQVSPLQIWVLSKKARVLKMIEDLIRQHNDEIATVSPMTELLNQPNNIPLSNRLTEILNTMSSTTESIDVTTESSTPFMTSPLNLIPVLTTNPVQIDNENKKNTPTTYASTNGEFSTTTQSVTDIFSRLGLFGSTREQTKLTTKSDDSKPTTPPSTESSNSVDDSMMTTLADTTTDSADTDTTLLTTESSTDITTQTDADASSTTPEPSQKLVLGVSTQSTVANEPPKKDYVIFGILPNNTVVRKDPNEDPLETLTEASPYIVYSLLPNNTVIRRFPNGTRVPRVMQKIDILPITPWSLRNPYSPIHNNPAIVRPHNPIRVSTNLVTSTDTSNNGTENRLTNDTVNNQQQMIPSIFNIKNISSLGVTTTTNKPPAEKSTASHVLSLRTSTMLPSVDEILLNSISSAVKEEMVISSMTSSTYEPRILTLDIDPETKQIRTEKPGDGSEGTVFKYIPIDEVTSAPQDSNVLKLASTRSSIQNVGTTEISAVTEMSTQTPQIQTRLQTDEPTTTAQVTVGTPMEMSPTSIYTTENINLPLTTTSSVSNTSIFEEATTSTAEMTAITTEQTTTTTTMASTTTTEPSTTPFLTTTAEPFTTTPSITTQQTTTDSMTTVNTVPITTLKFENRFLDETERNAKSLNVFSQNNQVVTDFSTIAITTTKVPPTTPKLSEEAKLLQALLAANAQNPSSITVPNANKISNTNGPQTTTSRSIEDDIRQFEEDTKLLKALLAATGQNPANLNIPSLEHLNIPPRAPLPRSTTARLPSSIPTTTTQQTTTERIQTTTQYANDDIKKLTQDAQLLQALLQATGQNTNNNIPIISSVASNVRIASNPRTTSIASAVPTTSVKINPIYTSRTTTFAAPMFTTELPILTTFQPQTSTTESEGISSTLPPKGRRRLPTTTVATARRAPISRFTVTTEIPSTSTFSDEEDLQFLQNLKTVLKSNPNTEDPEAALANRIIALAVERSLNEIESGKQANEGRTGKTVVTTPFTRPFTTTTTTTTTSTTVRTTTVKDNTPSLEDDIKQFQEDTKLLQALIKATGQDPSKFNIPTLPSIDTTTKVSVKLPGGNADLNLLSNLLASPSPLNEPFEPLTQKPKPVQSSPRPFGARIAVKDDLKNEKDDAKLLQTLVNLQGARETTTQRGKLAITGQSPDEALKKLIQQTNAAGMVSEATKAPVAISTEYGKSNDALLAALLKEQGFGPTTASSLDEQVRLAALLNQVVVTPKARRTTTLPPPPPPPPRRPILDGLAWLWQQWRETAPGPPAARPNRRPSVPSSPQPSAPINNWFGSGPFVGNADDRPSSNRVPLEPPRAVVADQGPGRGQLVSAAINVTRAFSQFLGAAIAGAAQTVQSVIRAGQRAATDAYGNGSG